jgi:hypothetical protein
MLGVRIVAEPDGWIFVVKDACMIMLGECPDDMPPSELGCHNYFAYLRVTDADQYYNDHRESRTAHPGSRIPHLGSRIPHPGSRIPHSGSRYSVH